MDNVTNYWQECGTVCKPGITTTNVTSDSYTVAGYKKDIMKSKKQKEEKAILTFLKQTREGKYVKIDESSLSYSRLTEQAEEYYYSEDEYFYGWI